MLFNQKDEEKLNKNLFSHASQRRRINIKHHNNNLHKMKLLKKNFKCRRRLQWSPLHLEAVVVVVS